MRVCPTRAQTIVSGIGQRAGQTGRRLLDRRDDDDRFVVSRDSCAFTLEQLRDFARCCGSRA